MSRTGQADWDILRVHGVQQMVQATRTAAIKDTFDKEDGMKQEYCVDCNKLIMPVIVEEIQTHKFQGHDITFPARIAKCPDCGCEFLTHESHDWNLAYLQNAIKG